MRVLHDFAQPDRQAPVLTVLLPGALQQPEDFVQAGFIDAVRKRGLPIDVALADLGLHYIGEATDGTALHRIDRDLVQPARRRNYREIWLAGISIGGFMALAYADQFPGNVSRLCLLSPYPGSRIVANEIKAAGGIGQWNMDAAADDAERRIWHWLKSYQLQPQAPGIHFAYGREDRFAAGQQLMAESLPPGCVDSIGGDHDWPTWRRLWENFLDQVAPHFQNHTTNTVA